MRRRQRPRTEQRPRSAAGPQRARRDRHGRGLRGPLAPAHVPLATTAAERFDELVLDAADDLRRRHPERLEGIDFGVEDVPRLEEWERDWVPLGRSYPATGTRRALVVVYRRPVEGRADGRQETAELVRDVVVEELAELLGLEPEDLDPDQ